MPISEPIEADKIQVILQLASLTREAIATIDTNKIVRNAAKEALEEILVLVSQRESVYKYIRLALVKVNDGLHTNLSLGILINKQFCFSGT